MPHQSNKCTMSCIWTTSIFTSKEIQTGHEMVTIYSYPPVWNFIKNHPLSVNYHIVLELCNMVTYISINVLFSTHHHLGSNQGMVRTPPDVPYDTTVIICSKLTIQVTIVTCVVPQCSNEGNGTIWRIFIVSLS